MQDLLTAVAALLKAPESLVRRSAEARAKASGSTAADVLRAWAGGGEPAAPAAPAAPSAVSAEPVPAAAAQEPSGPAVEVLEPEPRGDAPTPDEPAAVDRVSDEPAAVGGGIPRWLVAVFLVIPAFAVLYALFLPNGPNCGDSGKLAVDPATGLAVNCDGSDYGIEVVNYFSLGEEIYGQCSSCHGANGGGGGNFPAFADGALDATFPQGACSDQVEWVRLGSAGWPDPTYGATAKEVGGSGAQMPAFGNVLSEEELRAVVLFERVQFSGYDLDATLTDCGLGAEDSGE